MALSQEIFVNKTTKKLSLSSDYFFSYTLTDLLAGETVPFLIGIIEDSPTRLGAIASVNAIGLSLDIALLSASQAAVLSQSSLTLVGNQFSGNLNLTVAAVTGAVSSGSPTVTCIFEIQIGDGGNYIKAQFPVLLKFSGVTNPVVPSPVPPTYLLNTDAAAIYVAKAGTTGFIMLEESTNARYLITLVDGQLVPTPLA